MNRIAVFSHYSSFNRIEDYVIYFLQELKKYVSNIIFVSDCFLTNEELQKINNLIHNAIIGKHCEYDFGSYKRGFKYALENGLLNNCDELLFINDSCYAPLFPFDEMFDSMSNKDVDFWGITSNFNSYLGTERHVQSYFIAFKPNVFKSEIFRNFMFSITKEETKKKLISKYEIGLTKILSDTGYKYDVYSEFSKTHYASHILYYKQIIKKERIPFVKRSIPLLKAQVFPVDFEYFIKNNSDYKYELIEKDKQNKQNLSFSNILLMVYKFLIRNLLILIRYKGYLYHD